MSGSLIGGQRAAATNKKKQGADFYARIGAMGGAKSRGGGFSGDPERARMAGAIGGRKSKRGVTMDAEEAANRKKYNYYKSRIKHFKEALKYARTEKRKASCLAGVEHYEQLFNEVKEKLNVGQK